MTPGARHRPGAGRLSGAAALLLASHPDAVIAVTAVTTMLAALSGRSAAGCVVVAVTVLAGQLSVGWSNDWIDSERDARAHRTDKPVVTGRVARTVIGRAAAFALAAAVVTSPLSGWRAGLAHLVAVAAAWAYNLRLKATWASVVPYALAFGLLPVYVWAGLPGAPAPPGWLPAAGALLGAGAHFANVLPDLADDRAAGVWGLPQRCGLRASHLLAAGLVGAASAVILVAAPLPVALRAAGAVASLAAIGAATLSAAPPRLAFRAVLALAAIDVVLLVIGVR